MEVQYYAINLLLVLFQLFIHLEQKFLFFLPLLSELDYCSIKFINPHASIIILSGTRFMFCLRLLASCLEPEYCPIKFINPHASIINLSGTGFMSLLSEVIVLSNKIY